MKTLRRLIRRVRRLAHWLPIIWQDKDWDHAFLVLIVATKLETMAEFWASNEPITSDREARLGEIVQARDTAWRLADDQYSSDAQRDSDWNALWDVIRLYGRWWWD